MVNSMTPRCPGPMAAKQAQIMIPPPPCFTVGMMCLCIMAKYQKACGLFRCSFANLSDTAMFFLFWQLFDC